VVGAAASSGSHSVTKTKTITVASTPAPARTTATTPAQATNDSASRPTTSDTMTDDSPTPDPTSAPAAAENLTVGSTATLTGNDDGEQMDVKLIAVHVGFSAGEYDTPDAGKHYVAAELMLKNTGTAVYSDSPDNGAELIDSRDNQIDSELLVEGPFQSSSDVKLAPGAQRRVFCDFEVPNGEKPKQFQFTLDSGFADDTGEWHL